MIDLDRLIEQANEMPPFPASTVRLAQLVASPDCNLADVAELIAYDQALTVRLLRSANSAANAGATRVTTAQEAVTRLGTTQVLTLAVAAGARPHLEAKVPAYGLDEGALWRHAVAAAVAAETAPKFCAATLPAEAFTAALLHDIGKLVMGRFLDPDILRFIALAREEDFLSQLDAETLLLGVHHGEIGGLIAQHWQLPARVVQGITFHHNPDEGMDVVCDLTWLANHVAKHIEAGLDGEEIEFAVPSEVAEHLGANARKLEELCTAATSRFAQVSQRYNAV
jgi:HD-like signal output (HDOD) protein